MKTDKKFKRQCCFCKVIKDKNELIKITKDYKTGNVIINTDGKFYGRSVYICKNFECIENGLKKKKINSSLRSVVPENIKQELYNLLKN